jgi:hypothetical protein
VLFDSVPLLFGEIHQVLNKPISAKMESPSDKLSDVDYLADGGYEICSNYFAIIQPPEPANWEDNRLR